MRDGAVMPATPASIQHGGRELRPLTMDVIARLPDLDPACYGTNDPISRARKRVENRRRFCDVWQPGDVLYYWSGPFSVLSGGRGIAVVRGGLVVATFQTGIA